MNVVHSLKSLRKETAPALLIILTVDIIQFAKSAMLNWTIPPELFYY